jgi:hypothetical protein
MSGVDVQPESNVKVTALDGLLQLLDQSGMTHMTKPDSLLIAVREVLFRDGDPIGVNGDQSCQDEYDSYETSAGRANVNCLTLKALCSAARGCRFFVGNPG